MACTVHGPSGGLADKGFLSCRAGSRTASSCGTATAVNSGGAGLGSGNISRLSGIRGLRLRVGFYVFKFSYCAQSESFGPPRGDSHNDKLEPFWGTCGTRSPKP